MMENVGDGDRIVELGDGAHGCSGVGGGVGGDCEKLTRTVSSSRTASILDVLLCLRPRPRQLVCLRVCLRD